MPSEQKGTRATPEGKKKHYAPIATPTRGWPPAGGVNTPYGKFCRGKSHVAGSYATQDGWSLPTAGEEEEEAAIVFCFFVADMYTSQPMGRSCGYRDDIRSRESIKIQIYSVCINTAS